MTCAADVCPSAQTSSPPFSGQACKLYQGLSRGAVLIACLTKLLKSFAYNASNSNTSAQSRTMSNADGVLHVD